MLITLNPGPSQLSPETRIDIGNAISEGILEISHRSKKFSEISANAINGLRTLYDIPEDYHVFYLSSATACWHSIMANVVDKEAFCFVNGAFSEKFVKAGTALNKTIHHDTVEWGTQNDFTNVSITDTAEMIGVCYNETSTGVMTQPDDLSNLRKNNPDKLLAVDLTSCAGAVDLNIAEADLWYFSVQKCLGLPAGLALLIVSPQAYKRSIALAEQKKNLAGQWQWAKLNKPMTEKDHQTPQTPNVFNIYLLAKQLERWNQAGGITKLVNDRKEKEALIHKWIKSSSDFDFFVENESHRSSTVYTIKGAPNKITKLKAKCQERGMILGGGYGKTKKDVFRIANFPNVTEKFLELFVKISTH